VINVQSVIQNLTLPMLQHPQEIIPFCEWLQDQNVSSILEIGTGPGGTTLLFGALCDKIISVDIPNSEYGSNEIHAKLREVIPNFAGILGDSQTSETEQLIAFTLDDFKVDLLFIDGDHRRFCVQHDYDTYKKFVRIGGWIAFHDINAALTWPNMGVPLFWQDLEGEKLEFSVHADWGGIGVVTNI
jgi:predicted O-methyltransferase YrrM